MSESRREEERTETPLALVGTYLAALPSRCLMSMSGKPAVKKASAALSSVWLSRSEWSESKCWISCSSTMRACPRSSSDWRSFSRFCAE